MQAPPASALRPGGEGIGIALPGLSPRLARATVAFAWPEFPGRRTIEDPTTSGTRPPYEVEAEAVVYARPDPDRGYSKARSSSAERLLGAGRRR